MSLGRFERSVGREAGRALVRFFFTCFHQLRVRGVENVPSAGPVVIIANHGSFFDPVIIGLAVRRRVRFMAWRRVFEWPVVGRLSRWAGAFPVDLEKRQDLDSFQAGLRLLADAEIIGVFPEGSRAVGPLMEHAKLGAVYLAYRAGAAIVPVSLAGVHDVWPRRRWMPQPGLIAATFHPPIFMKKRRFSSRDEERRYLRQIMTDVQRIINDEIAAQLERWSAEGAVGASARRFRLTGRRDRNIFPMDKV